MIASARDRWYRLIGAVVAHVLRGYLRHHFRRVRRRNLAIAAIAGVAVAAGIAAVSRRGSGGSPVPSRGGEGMRGVERRQ
jgi:hypothetical protein